METCGSVDPNSNLEVNINQQDESIDDFTSDLHKLAEKCEYGA